MAPFSYQTISVNDNARNNLINPRSMGPRNFAFTEEGLQLAWAAAPSLVFGGPELAGDAGLDDGRLFAALFDRRVYVDRVTEKLGGSTPYWDQASEYHGIVKGFAKAYLDCYYATPDALLDDAQDLRQGVLALLLVAQRRERRVGRDGRAQPDEDVARRHVGRHALAKA